MNKFDLNRNANMLCGSLAKKGYMRWWHSFHGVQPGTGEMRTFFIEYFLINPSLGQDQPIIGQHPYYKKRDMKPSYALVKAGVFPDASGNPGKQLHAFYPIRSLRVAEHPFHVELEDCMFSEQHTTGYVDISAEEAGHDFFMTDAGTMEWDLEIHKAIACHTGYLANRLFTALNLLESYWHGEGIRSYFRGSVTLDGVTYEVSPETCSGYADKHWGRDFNSPWLQLASCNLVSERTGKELRHSALAINRCCPKFFGIPLQRKLMIQLTYTGEDFEYNLGKTATISRCKWKVKETNKRFLWHIVARNKTSVIKIFGSCFKDQMMTLDYEAPDGTKSKIPLWAGNNGLGTIEIYRRTPGGKQLIDRLYMNKALWEYRRSEK